ncbi:MAG: hypothetical protein R2813_07650 [Flavobacteriales bacterium]
MQFSTQLLILLMISTIYSCDPCYNTQCVNGGECKSGRCLCDDGAERPLCNKDLCLEVLDCPPEFPCAYGICQCPDTLFGSACQFQVPTGVAGYYFGEDICAGQVFGDEVEYDVLTTDDPSQFLFDKGRSSSEFHIQFINESEFRIPAQKVETFVTKQTWEGTGTFINNRFVLNIVKGNSTKDTCMMTLQR